MKPSTAWVGTILMLAACGGSPRGRPPAPQGGDRSGADYDVVVYGDTSAAITAAMAAARMSKRVVVVAPARHLGGLTTGGLGATDIGAKATIGGIAREFYENIFRHYQQPSAWVQEDSRSYFEHYTNRRHQYDPARNDPVAAQRGVTAMWTFEPKVAEQIFVRMLREAGVRVVGDQWLDRQRGVEKAGGRIVAINTLDGHRYAGRMFVDATYEGDLMAAAGVAFHVGRESNAVYGETYNGVQRTVAKHDFEVPVDPYVVPGDPASGLLPEISNEAPGPEGTGDARVQAYNFRMTLTRASENRLAIVAPPGYDPGRYELLRRYIAGGVWDAIHADLKMPNHKTDTNAHGAFSSDYVGGADAWPEADYATRAVIYRAHKDYVMGFWYFLQNDPRLPEEVRRKAGQWGLCRDEFLDNDHWPRALYVREARRMKGALVMTEHHALGRQVAPEPIALATYMLDSHHTHRFVQDGRVHAEGNIGVPVPGPYPIGYRAILPRAEQASNLLVPVALSASHVAYGSIRMEPVFMMLGQSAGAAAALAIDQHQSLKDLAYDDLAQRLSRDGQILSVQ